MLHILSLFLFSLTKISILGDFSVHHKPCLSSAFTGLIAFHLGGIPFNFAILHYPEEPVQHLTRILDYLGNILIFSYLFLTTNNAYDVTLSSPLRFYDHKPVSLSSSTSPIFPQESLKQRFLWHFTSVSWEDLCRYHY